MIQNCCDLVGDNGSENDFAVDCESGVSSLIRGPQGHPEDAVPDDGRSTRLRRTSKT